MKVLHIICENGLGHFKRSIGLLHALSSQYPALEVQIVCRSWQLERLKDWKKLQDLQQKAFTAFEDIISPSVKWSLDPAIYEDGRLTNWKKRLDQIPTLQEVDLVISDNLVGVLEKRPDTLLVGSFLWMDIFRHTYPTHAYVKEFIADSERLLQIHQPNMIGIEPVMMPGVKEWTNSIPVHWFGQQPQLQPRPLNKTPKIAILSGATSLAKQQATDIFNILFEHTNYNLVLPDRVSNDLQLAPNPRILSFGFEIADFHACDLVICRPGIGTMTDCIVANAPMLFFSEGNNLEMQYNAQQLKAKGLAEYLTYPVQADALLEAVRTILQPEQNKTQRQKLAATPSDGFEQAASWIINQYF